jgi:hypothetical protein
MTFKEEIDLQLRDNKTISYELLSQLKETTYFSGKRKQIGDTVLFGMLSDSTEEEGEFIRLITFHEEEIGILYKEDSERYSLNKPNKLPNLKRIENGD